MSFSWGRQARAASAQGAFPHRVRHGHAAAQQPGDVARHGLLFGQLLLSRLGDEEAEGFLRIPSIGAGPQGLPFPVIQLPQLLGHDGGEELVYRPKDAPVGAEILRQQDALAPAGGRIVGIAVVFSQEKAGVRQAEAVDGLLHVPHHGDVLPSVADGEEDAVLHPVAVLVFVHQDLVEAAAQLPSQGGGSPTILLRQQLQGQMLQVGEIQRAPPPLFGGVGIREIPHQGQELPRHGAHRRHILCVGGAVLLEKALQLLHGGAAGIPPGLGPGGHGVVPDAFVAPQGGKADILAGGGFIPALLQGQGEVLQVVQGGAQGGAVARLRLGLGAQALQGFLHLPAPEGGEALRPVQQGFSPGGLPRVGKGDGGLHLPLKPGAGVRVALHGVVGIQHHIH